MQVVNFVSFFLLLAAIDFVSCHKARARRHYDRDSPACDVVCDAQWKSEFHLNFQKLYDTEYFEVPLDSTITKNRASLKLFCSSTNQKYSCLRRECKINRTPWTPEKHICIGNYDNFDRNINCLSLTDRYVQKECSSVCNKIKIEVSPLEYHNMAKLVFTSDEKTAFIEQNQHCNFIACHQMCHEYIINKVCIDSAAAARAVVKNYYDEYLNREYNSLLKNDHEELYSSFCRRVTRTLDENEMTANMTSYNNQVLNRMKHDIRTIFAILD